MGSAVGPGFRRRMQDRAGPRFHIVACTTFLALFLFEQRLLSFGRLRLVLSGRRTVARSNALAMEVYSIMPPHPVFQYTSRKRHIES